MITVATQIIHKEVEYKGFYIPSVEGFKKGCKTENTMYDSIKKLVKTALKTDFVKDFKIVVYEGKYESYKNNKILYTYTKGDLCNMGLI